MSTLNALLPIRRAKPSRFSPSPAVVLDARVVTGAGGGPDKTILNSPRFLEPLGYRNVCAYLHPPGDEGYSEIERKARRYGAPLVSVADRGPWDWRVASAILDVCKRERVQIWHGHDYKTNALGLLLHRFHPMRLVTTVHGWVKHTSRTPLYYRVDRFCLPRYEKVFCVSEDLLEECREGGVPPETCELLENGIDTREFVRTRSTEAAKLALGFRPDKPLIGAVGRLSPEKSFDSLIACLPALIRRGLDATLLLIGDGEDRSRLLEVARDLGVADRVVMPGWCGEVRPYFEAMDVFALSSLREGLPNVLLEAMAMEVPVVATRIAGIPRVVESSRNGYLVRPGDLEGMSACLAGLLSNPDLRAKFATAARATIEARYSFAARMQRIAGVYDELLAEPCPLGAAR